MKKTNTTVLSKEDFKRFRQLINEENQEPNEKLKKAVEKHNELIKCSD